MPFPLFNCFQRFSRLFLAAFPTDTHDNADDDRGGDDDTKQGLYDGAAGICAGDDTGDQRVDHHKGDYADHG